MPINDLGNSIRRWWNQSALHRLDSEAPQSLLNEPLHLQTGTDEEGNPVVEEMTLFDALSETPNIYDEGAPSYIRAAANQAWNRIPEEDEET